MQSTELAETTKSAMIAVVGAGTMGSSIVVALLAAGYSVLLKETDQAFLDKGMANINRLLSGRVKKGLAPEEAQLQRSR
ncbi:3-hydroxyacyl-CoA dehydrogenase, partial [bacterium]|nr:3-hydroxyacyl-CoA dehydrogenase [bacterium]